MRHAFLLLLPCLLALGVPPAEAFTVPLNDGFVTVTLADEERSTVLTAEQEQQLEDHLSVYKAQTGNEIAILIIPSLGGEPIADTAVEVGRAWGVGTAENDNGILILMSYEDREVFIATGYGLEGAVPDIVAKGIIEQDMLPAFRDGRFGDGLEAAVAALEKHIGGEYTQERYAEPESSGGGPAGFLIFFAFILFDFAAALLGRTKSWWLGGVLGAIAGVVFTVVSGWWLSIPILVLLGLLFDYVVSRAFPAGNLSRRRRGSWISTGRGGSSWGGGGSSGGGFGGFSGGSFGGGGAGGRW